MTNEIMKPNAEFLAKVQDQFQSDMNETRDKAAKPQVLRAKICKGGYSFFEIYQGDEKIAKPETLEGIIVLSSVNRSYYATEFGKAEHDDTYPDCRSANGVDGVPRDHIEKRDFAAKSCEHACGIPKNAWTANGEAYCREMRSVIFIDPTSGQAYKLFVSPSSIRVLDNYYRYLATPQTDENGDVRPAVPYTFVVTKFSLHEETTKSGFEISKLDCEMVRYVTEQEYGQMESLKAQFAGAQQDLERGDAPAASESAGDSSAADDDIPF